MNIVTYRFHTTSGVIPGIISPQPDGQFHAGQIVDIDTDTSTIIAIRQDGIQPEIEENKQIIQVKSENKPKKEL